VLHNIVTGLGYHPLYDGKLPTGAAAMAKLPSAAWVQILFAIGVFELTIGKQDPSKMPGDVTSFGDAFKAEDQAEFEKMQLRELKNGRLAMFAILGELVQEQVTGQTTLEQLAAGHLSPFGDGQGFF